MLNLLNQSCRQTNSQIDMHPNVHMPTHAHRHRHTDTDTHTHIHKHTHMYIHTQSANSRNQAHLRSYLKYSLSSDRVYNELGLVNS